MNPRLQCLRSKLKAQNIEGMIVANPINIKYLTGIEAEGVLLLTRKENIYITDSRYIEMVQSIVTIEDEIVVMNVKNLTKEDYEGFFLFCENVGFEEEYITYAKYKECLHKYKINNFVETEHIIERQRVQKDSEEIENIRKACELTDKCFEHLLGFIKVGMTEKEIAYEIERYFIQNGATGLAFDPIVDSGINSSKPHAVPTDKTIQAGDIITLDFGCKYNGYCSDMTRTIFVGYVQEYIKSIYDLVLKNQEQILSQMYDGVNTKLLFKTVDNNFRNYRQELVHALGHGVGLDVHEEPSIGLTTEKILRENMIVTNEPGIYIPGKFGVRIEDTVLITKTGNEVLTKSNKDYIIIENTKNT